MAATVSFGRWFGSFFLRDQPATQRTLTLAKICKDLRRSSFGEPASDQAPSRRTFQFTCCGGW
jgi:hypothetical protein